MSLDSISIVLLSTVCVVVFLFGSFLNISLFFFLVCSKEQRKRISSLYLLSLLCMQIFACFTEVPYYFFSLVLKMPPPPQEQYASVCRVSIFTTYTIAALRTSALTIMSLDRYLAIVYPFTYERFVTVPRVAATICIKWVFCCLCLSPLMIIKNWTTYEGTTGYACGLNFRKSNEIYIGLVGLAFICIPLCLMLLTNAKVYMTARKQHVRIQGEQSRALGKSFGETFTMFQESELMQSKLEDSSMRIMALSLKRSVTSRLKMGGQEATSKHHSSKRPRFSHGYGAADKIKHREDPAAKNDAMELNAIPDCSAVNESLDGKKPEFDGLNTTMPLNNNLKSKEENLNEKSVGAKGNCTSQFHGKSSNKTKREGSILFNTKAPSLDHSAEGRGKWSGKTRNFENESETTAAMNITSTQNMLRQRAGKHHTPSRHRHSTSWNIISSTLLIVFFFFITYTPFLVTRLLTTFTTVKLSIDTFSYTALITITGNLVNPAIILGTRRKLKQQFIRIIFSKEP